MTLLQSARIFLRTAAFRELMASNMSDGDVTKKSKSSSNENNFNQKSNKSRNHKNNSNEKTGMEGSNGSKSGFDKNRNGQDKQSESSSSDEGKWCFKKCRTKTHLTSFFRSWLEVSSTSSRIHLRVVCSLPEFCRQQHVQLRFQLCRSARR